MTLVRIFVLLGIVCLLIAAIIAIATKYNIPLGKLPGDIKIEKKNVQIYIPLATSILISLILSLIFLIIRWRS